MAQGARSPQEPDALAQADRHARANATATLSELDRAHACDDQRSQEEDLAAAQLQQKVKRLIRTLPRKLRDALLLAGSGEYTYEQISHILGVPVGTVKWRVSEARRVLKQKIAAVGHAMSERL